MHARLTRRLRHFTLDVGLDVGPGSTVVLVGPSGSGKTSVLHAIAGLAAPDEGLVEIGDRTVFDSRRGIDVPPEERGIGLVFQDYALFPHLTVEANVAYGLVAQRLSRAAVAARVAELLDRFGIRSLAGARPAAISGGERQRVALARALAIHPRLLLLDEPLAALDAGVRRHVRRDLRDLLARLGITTLVVTHDYEDALVLGREILVMDRGRIVRAGSHEELLLHPGTRFVAEFTGVNYFDGVACPSPSQPREIRVGETRVYAATEAEGDVSLSFFPTDVSVSIEEPHSSACNVLKGPIREAVNLGGRIRVQVAAPIPVVAEMTPASFAALGLEEGRNVYVSFKATSVRVS